jgi:pyruvate/2-oxoglutarate dehydrogenase complex dihydrolipoamide dehydrogenase (E3) component
MSAEAGHFKALLEEGSDRILGFTAIGAEAGEVMPIVQTTIASGLPFMVLRDAILTHPTMAERLTFGRRD